MCALLIAFPTSLRAASASMLIALVCGCSRAALEARATAGRSESAPDIELLGIASIPSDARDLSGLTGVLGDGTPQDQLGAFGSVIAWTFGSDLSDERHVWIVTSDNDFLADAPQWIWAFAIGRDALVGFHPQMFDAR